MIPLARLKKEPPPKGFRSLRVGITPQASARSVMILDGCLQLLLRFLSMIMGQNRPKRPSDPEVFSTF